MTIVTLDEARERLADLLAQAANGETVVIADGGRTVGRLTGPPAGPVTPEEIDADRVARAKLGLPPTPSWPPPPPTPYPVPPEQEDARLRRLEATIQEWTRLREEHQRSAEANGHAGRRGGSRRGAK